MSTISRRAFLKTVGIGALSVAAMSVLAGCDGTTQQPVVDNSIGTISATSGMTYVVGDYAVMGNFDNVDIAWLKNPVAQAEDAALNRTLKGYVSNYDMALMNQIAISKNAMAATLGNPLSAEDVADILSNARNAINDNWASDFIQFSFDITNFTTEDVATDVMLSNAPSARGFDVFDYIRGSSWGATGIVSSKIVTASTGSCAIWANTQARVGTPTSFADDANGTIKAAVDEKTGVTARFDALVVLPRDWTSVDITITVPGATKAVVYSVTRANVNWNSMAVEIEADADGVDQD